MRSSSPTTFGLREFCLKHRILIDTFLCSIIVLVATLTMVYPQLRPITATMLVLNLATVHLFFLDSLLVTTFAISGSLIPFLLTNYKISYFEIGLGCFFRSLTVVTLFYFVTRMREHKRELRHLIEERETYIRRNEQILDLLPDAVITTDREGHIVRVNNGASNVLGFSREELLTMTVDDLVPERFLEAHHEKRLTYMLNPHTRSLETVGDLSSKHKTLGEVPVEISLSPVTIDKQLMIIATMKDVSRQRRILDKLNNSNADLEQFAYIASHDLQEPLRAVTSYIQLINKRYGELFDDTGREFMKFIVDGSTRMKVLINNLLDYSRLTSRPGAFSLVNLGFLVDDVLEDLAVSIKESNAHIDKFELPSMYVDRVQISQVFSNLLVNALKYCKKTEAPHVRIWGREEGKEWIFAVSDNGTGIKTEYFEKIFLLFNRTYSGEKEKGNGMGLAVCKKIIERHGGKIWVESTESLGSTFFFSIPLDIAHDKALK